MDTLTPTQRRLLDYLQRKIEAEGRVPSLRRASADLGVSHAAIARTLHVLEEKGFVRRAGRYERSIHILDRAGRPVAPPRGREVPVVGRITAGLPMYAQPEWGGAVTVDRDLFRAPHLFALRVQGDSMKNAGILDGDLVICEPRQFAENGEIVAALVGGDEATVKRFFLRGDHIELRPENPRFAPLRCRLGEVLVQGKVVGVLRGPLE